MARTRSRYAPDRGLTTRMVSTMFFIGLLYVVLVGVLLAVLRGAWPVILVVAGGLFVAQFWFSDRIAAYGMGAREVTPQEAPELHGAIDRICALADMPKPRVAVAQSDVPNAFATGRSEKTALVCATTGLLRRLEPEELEGVLAHEMSHVAHRDVAVMTIASFLGRPGRRHHPRRPVGRLRPQQPGQRPRGHHHHAHPAGQRRGVRPELPADPAALPLPRAVRRPHGRPAHRAGPRRSPPP